MQVNSALDRIRLAGAPAVGGNGASPGELQALRDRVHASDDAALAAVNDAVHVH